MERTRLAASVDLVGLLGPTEELFRQRHPHARMEVQYFRPQDVYGAVLGDEVDFGLVSYPKSTPGLAVLPWNGVELVVIAPENHRLAHLTGNAPTIGFNSEVLPPVHPPLRKMSLTARDLDGEDFVAFDQVLIRREVSRFFGAHDVHVNLKSAFEDLQMVREAVSQGLGISIVPVSSMPREMPIFVDGLAFLPLAIIHKQTKTRLHGASQGLMKLLLETSPDTPIGIAPRDAIDIEARRHGVDTRNFRLNSGRLLSLRKCSRCLMIIDLLHDSTKLPGICDYCGGELIIRDQERIIEDTGSDDPIAHDSDLLLTAPSVVHIGVRMIEDKSILTKGGVRYIPISLAAALVQSPQSTLAAWIEKRRKFDGRLIRTYTSPYTGDLYLSEESVNRVAQRFIKWPSRERAGPITLGETDDQTGFLSLPDAMHILGVSKRTMWLWATQEGKAPTDEPLDVIKCTASDHFYLRERDINTLKAHVPRSGLRAGRRRPQAVPQP